MLTARTATVVALLVSAAVSAEFQVREIPYVGDETSLVRVKADPNDFIGEPLTICGGLRTADYYNYGYMNAEDTHYSFRFVQVGKDEASPTIESATLYLSRELGRSVAAEAASAAEKGKDLLVRAKVMILPALYASDKQWDLMEMLDVQIVTKDWKGWGPWIIEEQKQKDQEARRQAKLKAEEAQRQAKLREEEARRQAKLKDEEARWRTWKDSTGRFSVKAAYRGRIGVNVQLEREDGKKLSISMDQLSEECQQWIRNRSR